MLNLATMSIEEIRSLNRSLIAELNSRTADLRAGFRIGQKVFFFARGMRHDGTITKINSKTIAVNTTTGRKWRVSPSLLKAL